MQLTIPRLVIAGLSGDSGKTLLSIGLCRALRQRGLDVAGYKKGPDYIDAAWIGLATGRPGRNLDTYMMSPEGLGSSLEKAGEADFILVEGNRGLYDGFDAAGTHSTAELAKRIGAAVVLVVDVTKSTRTIAAQVLGCQLMDPELELVGVVLNRVATLRQERIIREAVKKSTGLPVLGAIRRLKGEEILPGRHLGLTTTADHPEAEEAVAAAAEIVRAAVDLDALLELTGRASRRVDFPLLEPVSTGPPSRVAVAWDPAFCFYYPENIEALESAGACILRFSPLADEELPGDIDAVYLGGGFPEVHAEALASSCFIRRDLRKAAEHGLPIFAECGGLMALSNTLRTQEGDFRMAGVLDLEIEQTPRPVGHGYVSGRVHSENPWFPAGTRLRGHEFHYSRIISGQDAKHTVVEFDRGVGVGEGRDGIVKGSVWASYLHTHVCAAPGWAENLLKSPASAGIFTERKASWKNLPEGLHEEG